MLLQWLRTVLAALPFGREILEAVTALIAVAMLFYVSFWLIARLEQKRWLEFLRARVWTAVPMPAELWRPFTDRFGLQAVVSMYGQTECISCTYLPPSDLDRKPESIGIAIPNIELWLVDDHDRRLGPGELGQLVVRGATVMRGYDRHQVDDLRPYIYRTRDGGKTWSLTDTGIPVLMRDVAAVRPTACRRESCPRREGALKLSASRPTSPRTRTRRRRCPGR